MERIVDEHGKQLQKTAREGAQPMNQAEQERSLRVGTYLACQRAGSPLWKENRDLRAPTDAPHAEAIRSGLR